MPCERPNLELRRARAEDCGPLTELALRSKASNGYDEAFMAACVAELTVDAGSLAAGEVWLAEDDAGQVLGFFDLRLEADLAEVEAFFIAPAAKRRGIGRSLWAHLEARALSLGAARITIDSDPEAQAFYEAMGALLVGESPSASIPGRKLPRLEKRIG